MGGGGWVHGVVDLYQGNLFGWVGLARHSGARGMGRMGMWGHRSAAGQPVPVGWMGLARHNGGHGHSGFRTSFTGMKF